MIQSANASGSVFTGRVSASVIALLVLILVSSAPAQILTGTLTGTVSDAAMPWPGSSITLTSLGTGLVYKEKTDSAGV